MAAIGFNHVTVYGADVDELVEFYTRVFDLEQVQAPNLGVPAAWLRCGDGQLHLVHRETSAPRYHHFALTVDDFEKVYHLARAEDLFDEQLAPDDRRPMFELPDGSIQMYVRDPAGNLIEVDWPTASTLSDTVREQIVDRSDEHPQSKAQARAELFMTS